MELNELKIYSSIISASNTYGRYTNLMNWKKKNEINYENGEDGNGMNVIINTVQ